MLCYPAILDQDPETRSFIVSFPDIPFAHAVGEDKVEALLNAKDALVTAFEIFEEKREAIPMATTVKPGQSLVPLPVIIAGKVALYNTMLSESKRKADLAQMLNVAPTWVDHLLSFRHKSRIEQIETALAALGKSLVVEVV